MMKITNLNNEEVIMELTLIAAVSENYVIGKEGDIPWHIPEDLKRFKKLTTEYPIIMGRKTYESLPVKYRPLPDRLNIILSRDESYEQEGAFVYSDLEEVFSSLQEKIPYQHNIKYKKAFVIGGQQIYDLAMSLADKLEITHVKKTIEDGDAHFPIIDKSVWKEKIRENYDDYSFVTYTKC